MPILTVCDVAIDPRKGGMEAVWTYRVKEPLQAGDAVVVPLGTRSELAFVLRVYQSSEKELPFPLKSLRNVTSRVEGLGLPRQLIGLIQFVAAEYLCSEAAALSPALPPGVRSRLVGAWSLKPDLLVPPNLNPIQQEVIRVMKESGGTLLENKKAPAILKALKTLREAGLVERNVQVLPSPEKQKSLVLYRLCGDRAKIDRFLEREGKRKPAQALTLMQLQATERGALTAPEIKALGAVTDATLKALVQAGLLEEVDVKEAKTSSAPHEPNLAQRLAIDAVVDSVRAKVFHPFLLYGVTGSGKTEVYLRAASEALRMGRQVLYVVPEITLAAQAIGLLRQRFGQGVAVLHSNLPDAERLHNWLKVRDGLVSVVLGARSALFAPLSNIGLIVMDEEHEQAYKQESAPRYHAKTVALHLAQLHSCPIILGSATPSIESFFEAEQSENEDAGRGMTLLTLPERTASSQLPAVIVKDLGEGYRANHPSIFTDELKARMRDVLDRREQVILFLNRRAYAPSLTCRDCGYTIECPNCSVSLSFHRRDHRLRCHHCGYQTKPPDSCPKCQGIRFAPFGVGTERVEEAVTTEFSDVRVGRLDRDIAKRRGVLDETLASFRSGAISVLVGTQVVAKGLDFPNVTLVGVIAADVSLNLPDFRASERTFQLLSQVAGRAGRGKQLGSVVIQTLNPDHPAVVAAKSHEYLRFYEILKRERKEAGYPPFRRLINLVLTGESREAVAAATSAASEIVGRECPSAQVLGPVDCVIERAFGKWRRHVLVKLPPHEAARPVGDALAAFHFDGVQLTLDVDPYSMM
ncbi:MAG TPA: primosomal protein N' [Fimbriimonas sp.]|nr:primosomal protein N' [Fimbriimonas sp.]